jgi:hypothetical protein
VNPRWQVRFKGQLSPDAKAQLAQWGAYLVGQQVGVPARTEDEQIVWLRAADGDEAIASLKTALSSYWQFSDFIAEPVNYTMYLGFLESEHEALEAVTHEAGLEDPRVSMVVIHEPSKGSAELLLEIPAADQDAAVKQAQTLYAELRQRADLPPADALYGFLGRTGYFPTIPVVAPLRHVELGQNAHKLFDDGTYDYAVVTTQTACELLVFDGITELLEAQGESPVADFARSWFEKSGRTPSLKDDRLRELWTLLTGDKVQEQDWWHAYSEHLVRRHGVVHRGTEPTKAEADESLKATDAFRAHVRTKLNEALGREDL